MLLVGYDHYLLLNLACTFVLRPLKSSAGETKVAIMLFNPSEASANVTAAWAQVGLPVGKKAVVRDLWTKTTTELTELTAVVPPHGGVMVTATVSNDK